MTTPPTITTLNATPLQEHRSVLLNQCSAGRGHVTSPAPLYLLQNGPQGKGVWFKGTIATVTTSSSLPSVQCLWLGSSVGWLLCSGLCVVLWYASHDGALVGVLAVSSGLWGDLRTGHLCCGLPIGSTRSQDHEPTAMGGAACCRGDDLFIISSAVLGGSNWNWISIDFQYLC